MISAASSQLIFFAIAFKITSCNFIPRSTLLALINPGSVTTQLRRHFVHRTDHVLTQPDKSHTNDTETDRDRDTVAHRSFKVLESRVHAETGTMADLWSLRGLSWRQLAARTCRRSWEDEVFGQAARLAFYYFLGIFPALLLLLLLLDTFASTGSELRNTLLDSFQQIVPREASTLITKTVGELNARAAIGVGALWAALGAAWAILNGTWAMMVGLNTAYEVKEERRWWRILIVAFGLTISLGIMGLMALGAMLYGSRAGTTISDFLGVHPLSPFPSRVVQWLVIIILLLFSFASLYRFGPNLKDRRWQWSTPGAVVAIALWAGSTLLLRIYQDHFSSSQRIYGGLAPVATLLLWLYLTGAAILIGGETNSEIEKAAAEAGHSDVRRPGERRSGGTASDGSAS
jgi:membrane protein